MVLLGIIDEVDEGRGHYESQSAASLRQIGCRKKRKERVKKSGTEQGEPGRRSKRQWLCRNAPGNRVQPSNLERGDNECDRRLSILLETSAESEALRRHWLTYIVSPTTTSTTPTTIHGSAQYLLLTAYCIQPFAVNIYCVGPRIL